MLLLIKFNAIYFYCFIIHNRVTPSRKIRCFKKSTSHSYTRETCSVGEVTHKSHPFQIEVERSDPESRTPDQDFLSTNLQWITFVSNFLNTTDLGMIFFFWGGGAPTALLGDLN